MGKQKEAWWTYVKNVIRQYPQLVRELSEKRETKVTSSYEEVFGDNKYRKSSSVEAAVLRELPYKEQRKLDAVKKAVEITRVMHPNDCETRMKIIDMVYWKKTHTIGGAAMKIPCHANTAANWQAEFIRIVANELDLA